MYEPLYDLFIFQKIRDLAIYWISEAVLDSHSVTKQEARQDFTLVMKRKNPHKPRRSMEILR